MAEIKVRIDLRLSTLAEELTSDLAPRFHIPRETFLTKIPKVGDIIGPKPSHYDTFLSSYATQRANAPRYDPSCNLIYGDKKSMNRIRKSLSSTYLFLGEECAHFLRDNSRNFECLGWQKKVTDELIRLYGPKNWLALIVEYEKSRKDVRRVDEFFGSLGKLSISKSYAQPYDITRRIRDYENEMSQLLDIIGLHSVTFDSRIERGKVTREYLHEILPVLLRASDVEDYMVALSSSNQDFESFENDEELFFKDNGQIIAQYLSNSRISSIDELLTKMADLSQSSSFLIPLYETINF